MTEPVMEDVVGTHESANDTESVADAEALAAAMAGYGRKDSPRGDDAPKVESPPVETAPAVAEEDAPPPEPTEAERLAEDLAGLKAQVSALKDSADPDSVRRLHGEIGNINRTLKQIQTSGTPSSPELDAILAEAETAAEEFPEIAGPLIKAIKALAANRQAPPTAVIDDVPHETEQQIRERVAIEALSEEHPDWITVRSTPEFDAWLKSKTPEFQETFSNTWNPAVVSRGLSEFKESLKARERKQTRLAAAVTPKGTPATPPSSTIPDEEGAFIGYNKGPKRLSMR